MPTMQVIRPFEKFPYVECPGCKVAMTLKETRPLLFTSDLVTAIFQCPQCGTKTKREYKRERAAS
jgi:predicted RNA-binding Zn-ribbon protein involved in translation (DUF1610 family)